MQQAFHQPRLLPVRLSWSRTQLAKHLKISRPTVQTAELIALTIPDFARLHNPGTPLNPYQAWVIAQIATALTKLNAGMRGSAYRLQFAQYLKTYPHLLSWQVYQESLYPQSIAA